MLNVLNFKCVLNSNIICVCMYDTLLKHFLLTHLNPKWTKSNQNYRLCFKNVSWKGELVFPKQKNT